MWTNQCGRVICHVNAENCFPSSAGHRAIVVYYYVCFLYVYAWCLVLLFCFQTHMMYTVLKSCCSTFWSCMLGMHVTCCRPITWMPWLSQVGEKISLRTSPPHVAGKLKQYEATLPFLFHNQKQWMLYRTKLPKELHIQWVTSQKLK